MHASTTHWLEGRLSLEGPVEITPPHWVGDDEIVALETQFEPFLFERFGDGTLLVSPPTGGFGSARTVDLASQIARWNRTARAGTVLGPDGGVVFPDRALLSPDATFISAARWNALSVDQCEKFPPIVPDACFEIASRTDRTRTALKKIRAYLRYGVRLVVLIEPYRRRAYVGRAGDSDVLDLGDVSRIDCAPVMPGLVLDLTALRSER